MNSHKSRARRRRLAHAAALIRRRAVTYTATAIREAWVACLRAGWSPALQRPNEFLSTRGFNT